MIDNELECPHFMTHHAPIGAWSSLTLGLPGHGVGFEHEALATELLADLLVAVNRGPGQTTALPFVAGLASENYEASVAVPAQSSGSFRARWRFLPAHALQRRLSFCCDEYSGGGMTLRIWSPRPDLPDPQTGAALADEVCPGLLLEFTIDNRDSEQTARGLLGVNWRGPGRIRPLDWSSAGALCGVAMGGRWALGAKALSGRVFTLRDNTIARHFEAGRPIIHPGGNEGGICFVVPPRQQKTLIAAVGFHHAGQVTTGLDSHYFYTRYFDRVEAVVTQVLAQSEAIKAHAQQVDTAIRRACADPVRRQLLAQAAQGYYANSSLLETDEGRALWSVCEGQFAWRNTLDLAADHLPFELWRHPWVARAVIDLFIERYSYRDQVTFPQQPDVLQPGGLSFTHDQGNYTAYSPAGQSGYELPDMKGCYSYMTTEQLLNGIYCLTAYGLNAADADWLGRRTEVAGQLLDSLAAREHHEAQRRAGVLQAQSSMVGAEGAEITTYDALDEALKSARGNVYIVVKTWCAYRLLEAFFRRAGAGEWAKVAADGAERSARALTASFDTERRCLPANLLEQSAAVVIAALEPLAVPLVCGLGEVLARDSRIWDMLRQHTQTCLHTGVCLDAVSGHLRLSSGSSNTWPSKVILCHFVADWLLEGQLTREHPAVLQGLRQWMQVSAAERTVADQIDADTGHVRGGSYYPRHVTAAVWVGRP